LKKTSLAVVGAASLVLMFAMAAPMYAQDEEKPARQEEKAAQPKEDKAAQPAKEDKAATAHQEEKTAQPARSGDKVAQENKEDKAAQENKGAPQKPETGKTTQESKQVHETTTTQRTETQTQRTGGRIPDDRFRANFGREHVFVINRPVIVEGAPRFQYGGYWFIIANPWPVGWAYTDQVYVDYISGGYYLLSPVHPGVQVSINVVL
jgi:hypothetical protein